MRLREELEKHSGLPELTVGAEVYYFPGISESDAVFQLTIGGKRSILLEMAHAPWTERMYEEMEDLVLRRGLNVIVAHVDRYISPFRTHGIPERLAQLPVLVQANAEFFLHWQTAPMALRMLKQGYIHLLGSDCHDLNTRAPELGSAVALIEKKLGSEALTHIRRYQTDIMTEVYV
jgi:protein-tyrosine phosphatase